MSVQKFVSKATFEFGRRLFGEQVRREPATLKDQYRKFQYYQTTHYKLGLMEHDRLYGDNPVIKEAMRRLRITEPEVWDERSFRISRAINFDIKKMLLPKDEWVEYEQDVPYLQPFLAEIEREQDEERHWKKVLG
ncbi:unnamed protein product [Rotaria socialis]|uniref:Cytochrome b-c1 complex subunit 7 n=1 Tax=Rotaria socialis TaxID=392032 RepID=A0A820YMZ2_9BILA|nr:unnamed protein product [Rotaria socialis]CAF3490040.1 unnamed protein product [Rotaria socialis]CAF3539319.1 unnamed protein product [Rotaria socialis]CAF3582663.1 unnamed protein product [Rotaria socialis]CAF3678792.1 unnamed protein product [Rotaria socialis]